MFSLGTDVLAMIDVHVPNWKHVSKASRIVRGTSVKLASVCVHFSKRSAICLGGRGGVNEVVPR